MSETKTLREEIFKTLNWTYVDAEWGTNKILELIEKRIDEMISEELHRLDDSGKAEINIDCYNEIFLRDHVIEKLKQIKEMLK